MAIISSFLNSYFYFSPSEILVPPPSFSPAYLAYFCPFMVYFSFKIKLIKMCAGKRCCEQGPQRLLWTHLDLEQPIGKVGVEGVPLLHSQTLQSQDRFNHQHVRHSIANSLPTGREKHCSREDREARLHQEASSSPQQQPDRSSQTG